MKLETKIKWAKRLWRGLGKLPSWALYPLSDIVGFVLYHIVRYRRDVVADNLRIAFPEKSDRERRVIGRRFYRYFCDTFLEAPRMMAWSPEEMRRHFTFEGTEAMLEAARKGKNSILFIGHYGQWEWIPSIALWLPGMACAQIYDRLRDPIADELMLRNRQAHGSKSVERHETLRYMVRMDQSGEPFGIGFVADQSPSINQLLHYETFFDLEVPVHLGAEKLTHRMDLEPFFLDLRRVRRGYWTIQVRPMKPLAGAKPLTTTFYELLEEMIRRQPAYYLWSHKRFQYAKH